MTEARRWCTGSLGPTETSAFSALSLLCSYATVLPLFSPRPSPSPMRSRQLPGELPWCSLVRGLPGWESQSPCPSEILGLPGNQPAQVTKTRMSRENSESVSAGRCGDIHFCFSVRLAVFPLSEFEFGLKWPQSPRRALSFHQRDLPSLSYKWTEGVEPRLSEAPPPFYKQPLLPHSICAILGRGEGEPENARSVNPR